MQEDLWGGSSYVETDTYIGRPGYISIGFGRFGVQRLRGCSIGCCPLLEFSHGKETERTNNLRFLGTSFWRCMLAMRLA